MIRVEVCSRSQIRSMKVQEIYNYIKRWGFEHALLNCKIAPDRNTIVFYDEKAFEAFKETFKQPWKRIY